ncbi:Nuclear pore complex, Nup155 component (D Nup154, sc Nup157/Nup170) [Ceraceosorus bombacis]|uniref:Nuclear pore complex, Nup155 component (D Nup154, sc Nup157/Nup170) n=1 Tax=Ceraceosorus bombacis TaxID=401625 RepID=A0A0P1BJM7_9BASI|nr:Nuclear pore complex, Nup155 component (D Nup154, sc Nup157/Nup170) [Ceraceosorus bombacis]
MSLTTSYNQARNAAAPSSSQVIQTSSDQKIVRSGNHEVNDMITAGPSNEDFARLSRADAVVANTLREDEVYPDLVEWLGNPQTHARLYAAPPWAPVTNRRVLPIPDEVIEAISSPQSRAAQGLFPSISRAWIIIDTRLYLWSYSDGGSGAFESFEHPDSVIQSVGLARPKPGVFIDSISHLLVVASTSSIMLLGISFESSTASATGENGASGSSNPPESLKLYMTAIQANTEGVTLANIRGTDDGRIFAAGSDNNLYEISYTSAEGWWSSKCWITNLTQKRFANLLPTIFGSPAQQGISAVEVDSSRGLIWVLWAKREIELWCMSPGVAPRSIARSTEVAKSISTFLPNASLWGPPGDFYIEWIGAVPAKESKTAHLVAITNRGVRLFFSAFHSFGSRPETVRLMFCRLPPQAGQLSEPVSQQRAGEHARTAPQGFQAYHGHHAYGLTLMSGKNPEDPTGATDLLLGVTRPAAWKTFSAPVAPATYSQTGPHNASQNDTDSATFVLIRGATWDIQEVVNASTATAISAANAVSPLVAQFILPPRIVLVLTNSGINVITEVRPMDTLCSILEGSTGVDASLLHFIELWGANQTCAMALAVATRNSQLLLAPETLLAGTKGGVQQAETRMLGAEVVSSAWRTYFDFGGSPRYEPPPRPSMSPSDGHTFYSAKYHGLTIYLARLVRSFWTKNVTQRTVVPGEGERQQAAIGSATLSAAQKDLRSLQTFLTQNAQLFGIGSNARGKAGAGANDVNQIAFQQEQEAFDALRQLLARTIEAISFVLLLIDYRLPSIVSRCKPESQTKLSQLTFSGLVTTSDGSEVARNLVEAVIDSQMAAQVSIDAVAEVLQERCGGFCNADDVRLYKALESLRKAREAQNDGQKQDLLRESARLLNRASAHLPFEKLETICKDYRELGFDSGAIELPLRCAAQWDINGAALSYRNDGMPAGDVSRQQVFEGSMKCYTLVIAALEALDAQVAQVHQSADPAVQSTLRSLEIRRKDAYLQAEGASDVLFHDALYDWLLSRGKTDELLRMRTPYIEEYLRSEPVTLQRCLLLCDWYTNVGQNYAAAQVYAGLASSTELDLRLEDRVEYLAKASSHAKSSHVHGNDVVEFITNVDDSLETARVQVEVYSFTRDAPDDFIEPSTKQEILQILDAELLTMSTLYKAFAQPYSMHEVKLMIYEISEHDDPALVEQEWNELILEAEESAAPEQRFERVGVLIVDLGKRFIGSSIAFPIDILLARLLRYAFENRESQEIPLGWASSTLILAGAAQEEVYDVEDSLFEMKREPFNSDAGVHFLLAEIGALLTNWLDDLSSGYARSGFPAKRVDDSIGVYLSALSGQQAALPPRSASHLPEIQETVNGFKALHERVRRTF